MLSCALQAARGVLYLHSHQPPICHRDLKCSNLLVNEHWQVKVTDFGMSRFLPSSEDLSPRMASSGRSTALGSYIPPTPPIYGQDITGDVRSSSEDIMSSLPRITTSVVRYSQDMPSLEARSHNIPQTALLSRDFVSNQKLSLVNSATPKAAASNVVMTSSIGTICWTAPEVFSTDESASYSLRADVYSFGLCLWEMWERRRPYYDLFSHFDIIEAIMSGKRPEISPSCPQNLVHLIQRCWEVNPSNRPSFVSIVHVLKDELERVKSQGMSGGAVWPHAPTPEEEVRLAATRVAPKSTAESPFERSLETAADSLLGDLVNSHSTHGSTTGDVNIR